MAKIKIKIPSDFSLFVKESDERYKTEMAEIQKIENKVNNLEKEIISLATKIQEKIDNIDDQEDNNYGKNQ